MTTATNPLFKTLSISNPCFTSIPSIFNPKSLFFSISSKLNKLPLSVSVSVCLSSTQRSSFSLQKPTLSSRVISCVAQTSDWEQEGPSADEEGSDTEGPNTYDFGFGDAEAEVSDGGPEDNGEGFPDPPEDARLFVGNLSLDVDSEKLAQLFEGAGGVQGAEVIYARDTGRSRGFGFVTMSSIEEAEKAVEMFNNYELHGRILTVNIAAPRGSRPEMPPRESRPSFEIYVGNLPWDVDSTRLEQVFSEHGKVLRARVILERETGRSRGFGFVAMASEAEMNDAISAHNGRTLGGREIRVNVAGEGPRPRF